MLGAHPSISENPLYLLSSKVQGFISKAPIFVSNSIQLEETPGPSDLDYRLDGDDPTLYASEEGLKAGIKRSALEPEWVNASTKIHYFLKVVSEIVNAG